MLQFARAKCDRLIIGLTSDGSDGADVPYVDRQFLIDSLKLADSIVELAPGGIGNLLAALKPDIVVKGKEFEGGENIEASVLKKYGGSLIFFTDSTNEILDQRSRSESLADYGGQVYLKDPSGKYSERDLLARAKKFNAVIQKRNTKKKRVVVVGDLIIDRYVDCHPLGMSQEDPTLVVQPNKVKTFVGGAGIVARHLASLGLEVDFFTVLGDNYSKTETKEIINLKNDVNLFSWVDPTRDSTVKTRYRALGKTLLRVNNISNHDIDNIQQEKVLARIRSSIKKSDAVVFSDFNYGILPTNLVSNIISFCESVGKFTVADSQSSSQVGDVSRFVGADLIFATEREVRLAVNDFKSGIQSVAARLMEKTQCRILVFKLGKDGALMFRRENVRYPVELRAFNQNPVDVAGAGDAMLSTYVAAVTLDIPPEEAFVMSNIGAAVQCSTIGNSPIGSVLSSM